MAYTAFDGAKPTWTGTGTQFATDVRTNLAALRDMVATGFAPGWNYSVSGGTAEQPAILYLKRGTEWLRQTLTWGATGGADGNVTVVAVAYSANSGGAWDTVGTCTIAYDTAGNVTSTTWS